MRIAALSGWTSEQRHVVVACFLGWALDAFDFFLMVFILKDIAQEFNTQITDVTRTSHTSPPIQGLSHTFRKSPVACDWVVGTGVVPRHGDFNNLDCQTGLTGITGAKGIFRCCQISRP